jgi:hypothetical protein
MSLGEKMTNQQLLKTEEKEKKKHYPQANHLESLRQSFCLNINTRTGYWRSNTRT